MGTCSYRWEEWDSEKSRTVEKKCQKETWKRSDKFCIFHDPSPEKDVDLLKEKLEEQMESETERNNFIGYCFSADWDFSGKEFKIDAYFSEATFQNAYFSGATFQNADFNEATFKGATYFSGATPQNADFNEATFKGTSEFGGATFQDVDFRRATFQNVDFRRATFQNVDFRRATFQNANFSEATFNKKAELLFESIGELDLRSTEFLSRSYITADLTKTLFYRAFIENVAFINCTWPKKTLLYEEIHKDEENIDLSYKELETIYRDLKQTMQNHGDYSTAGDLYYREMECRKKTMRRRRLSFNQLKSYAYSFLKYTCGYGERPARVIGVSLLIILFSAFFFQFSGIVIGEHTIEERIIDYEIHVTLPTLQGIRDYLQCVYYSFVTFTTLGYGDIHPLGYSKVIACAESFTGAFFIALFVLVFGRKMMR